MHLGMEFVMLSFGGKICKEHRMPSIFMGFAIYIVFYIVVNDALDTLSSLNNIPT